MNENELMIRKKGQKVKKKVEESRKKIEVLKNEKDF